MRTYENTCQDCGTAIAAMNAAEPGTSLCFTCATGTTGTNLVFVNLDTDTVEDVAGDAFVIDTESAVISRDEIDTLDAADQYGAFGDDAAAIVRRVGVSVADLWAAYEWRRAMVTAGILADVEDYVVRLHGESAVRRYFRSAGAE